MSYKCICGTTQPEGDYICNNCGTHVELDKLNVLPKCPTCGNNSFTNYEADNNSDY